MTGALPVRIMRGGSSKGVFVREADLPPMGPARDALALRLFGAPDARQIDGLGGGDKLTSKMAVIGPAARAGCDLSYLFAQVGTRFADVDWTSNCGNISAGAALHGALDGLGRTEEGARHLRIEQLNTGRILRARVPMEGARPAREGEFEIGGVPGTGPRIDLDFADFAGSCLGLGPFPRGRGARPLGGGVPVEIVDMANLNVLVAAGALGVDLARPLEALQADGALTARLDAIRAAVMIETGLAGPADVEAALRRSVNPLLHIIAPPAPYAALDGRAVPAGSHDILARSYARGAFSKAFPGTGAVGLAVAARVPGTLAAGLRAGRGAHVRIGHPGGTLSVEVALSGDVEAPQVRRAVIGRTARLLMEGTAYL